MRISSKEWENYIGRLRKVNDKAAQLMEGWLENNGTDDLAALIDYAQALTERYGGAAAELACAMVENVAEAQGEALTAEAATLPRRWETFKAVKGAINQNRESDIPGIVGRNVKRAGADTILQNAKRHGAYFAWVPHGDTCAFCLTLASRGWQKASKKTIQGNHAEHIHNHCDCTFAIDFKGDMQIEGYEPDALLEKYNSFEGTPEERMNAWRREIVAEERAKAKSQGKRTCEDITDEFVSNATPGKGALTFEDGTSEEDRKTAEWIHEKFGGDIRCLAENPQTGKMPDSIWAGVYCEFKVPTTKSAIDDRIRKAQRQLYEALERDNAPNSERRIVLDISNSTLTQEEALATIIRRAEERSKGPTNIIIKNKDELIKILHIE